MRWQPLRSERRSLRRAQRLARQCAVTLSLAVVGSIFLWSVLLPGFRGREDGRDDELLDAGRGRARQLTDPPGVFTHEQRRHGAVLLHAVGLLYMFIALAIVCDEFFVPSLEVISATLEISPDVAGATFMAAGGSAPEFFTSLIGAMVVETDIGIGTIVGSAVFNVLFVIGACALAAPTALRLTWFPLARDSTFYIVDLFVLTGAFADGEVRWYEALLLFLLYVTYATFMRYSNRLEKRLVCRTKETLVEQVGHTPVVPMVSSEDLARPDVAADAVERALPSEQDSRAASKRSHHQSERSKGSKESKCTSFSAHSRAGSRQEKPGTFRRKSIRILLNADSQASVKPSSPMYVSECSASFGGIWTGLERRSQRAHSEVAPMSSPARPKGCKRSWSTNDLNDCCNPAEGNSVPVRCSSLEDMDAEIPPALRKSPTPPAPLAPHLCITGEGAPGSIDFHPAQTQASDKTIVVPVEKVMNMVPDDGQPPENRLVTPRSGTAFSVKPIKEDTGDPNGIGNEEEEDDDNEPLGLSPPGPNARLKEWVWYLVTLPIVACLVLTIPDVRRGGWRKFFVVSFCMSILWVAGFTYWMIWFAVILGKTCSIPDHVMGLTVLAAGTSVPDLLTSVIVARQGQGDMAISSSIGSNIFDVTVGLPIPWMLHSIIHKGTPVRIASTAPEISIIMLIAMLLASIGAIVCSRWVMTKAMGLSMLVMYFLFEVVSVVMAVALSPEAQQSLHLFKR